MYSELIKKSKEAKQISYSPYSKFKVGAAILLNTNKIILGTNIENASYGACMCAERSAIYSLISQGNNTDDIIAIAITSDMKNYTPPCSLCRQVMTEFFSKDVDILLVNEKDKYIKVNIDDLVPYQFTKEELMNV